MARALIAHLGRQDADPEGLASVRAELAGRHPGYSLDWLSSPSGLAPAPGSRVAFAHRGRASASLSGPRAAPVEIERGDALLLRPGEGLELQGEVDLAVFDVPVALPANLPTFIRPARDPAIRDAPGGCAGEGPVLRRRLLAWDSESGPYVLQGLNAHRVRMADSPTHYHPDRDGFDELYLVEEAPEGARLISSERVERIERPAGIRRREAPGLLREEPLLPGDLVWLSRGIAHRTLGGVLAQVVAIPGFRPGAVIGIDPHLRAINERLGLAGGAALPYGARVARRAPVE